jgi:PASTA domain
MRTRTTRSTRTVAATVFLLALAASSCGSAHRAADETVTVPRLLGLTNAAAMQALETQGLQWSYGKSGHVFSKAPTSGTGGGALADEILEQKPAAGARVAPHAVVRLETACTRRTPAASACY